jgi:DNA-directed RNA polymerase subunit H
MVPEHEIIPGDEIPFLLEKYGIKIQQFPKLLISDPLVIEVGAKVGDIVKITRKSQTAGETVYFRLVVSNSV